MASRVRTRKANFSTDEVLFLAEKYEAYKDIIDAKQKDVGTNKKKKDTWNSILEQHRARFENERTLDELKVRLGKLKTDSRESYLAAKKSRGKTGGGKPPKSPSPAEQKNIDLCEDRPGFKGLVGAESSATHPSMDISSDEDGEQKEIAGIKETPKQETAVKPTSDCGLPAKKKIKRQGEPFQELVEIEKKCLAKNRCLGPKKGEARITDRSPETTKGRTFNRLEQ